MDSAATVGKRNGVSVVARILMRLEQRVGASETRQRR